LTVFVATEAIIGSEYLVSTPNSEYYAGAMLIVVGLVSYFLLVHNEKYKKIAEEFKKERPTQKRKRMILIWLYIMGSFAVNLFSVWLAY
jgi:flagellar basal body-associated protein FliL